MTPWGPRCRRKPQADETSKRIRPPDGDGGRTAAKAQPGVRLRTTVLGCQIVRESARQIIQDFSLRGRPALKRRLPKARKAGMQTAVAVTRSAARQSTFPNAPSPAWGGDGWENPRSPARGQKLADEVGGGARRDLALLGRLGYHSGALSPMVRVVEVGHLATCELANSVKSLESLIFSANYENQEGAQRQSEIMCVLPENKISETGK
jgi:hypothetical protein